MASITVDVADLANQAIAKATGEHACGRCGARFYLGEHPATASAPDFGATVEVDDWGRTVATCGDCNAAAPAPVVNLR